MQDQPNPMRPIKRRRLNISSPDGFITDRSSKPTPKTTAPRFLNAFVNPTEEVSTNTRPKDKGKEMDILTYSKDRFLPFTRTDDSGPSKPRSSTVKEGQLVAMKDIQKALMLEGSKSGAALKPAPPPPRPPSAAPFKPLSTGTPMKQPAPPLLPTTAKTPQKALKPLQPPTLATPRKASDKDMRKISTTILGRLNDLSSENGTDELASILLRDQHPEMATGDSNVDLHAYRGLDLSPEKKSKGNSGKFIRYVLV